MIQKIADETGISLKVLIAISGILVLFVSTWVQINIKVADLSSEIKFMNAQLTSLIASSEMRMQNQLTEMKHNTSRDLYTFQVEAERALNDAGVKVTLPEIGE